MFIIISICERLVEELSLGGNIYLMDLIQNLMQTFVGHLIILPHKTTYTRSTYANLQHQPSQSGRRPCGHGHKPSNTWAECSKGGMQAGQHSGASRETLPNQHARFCMARMDCASTTGGMPSSRSSSRSVCAA